jgi:hypothetical protein
MSTRLRKLERLDTDSIDTRELLGVLNRFGNGGFSVRLPADQTGTAGKIYDALNRVIDRGDLLAKELDHVSNIVAGCQ